jgi:type IV secretory pathway VirJ component
MRIPMTTSAARVLLAVLAAAFGPVHAAGIDDLPLVELRAAQPESPRFMLFLSGDGGWAALDKAVGARLSQAGIGVVGFNTRKYFWSAQTPEATTRDIERVLRHYQQAWSKAEFMLAGYSFGADVLPVIVNRLPPDLRSRITSICLIALGRDATWEVHPLDWLPGISTVGDPIESELGKMPKVPLLCLYGAGEESLCSTLGKGSNVAVIGKGHHFGGEYDAVANRVLEFSRTPGRP